MAFAKLFETKQYGQILVLRKPSSDGKPAVFFMSQPPHDFLGVCSQELGFDETPEGSEAADHCFDTMTEEKAIEATALMLKQIEELGI
jgi:hypothetical protein